MLGSGIEGLGKGPCKFRHNSNLVQRSARVAEPRRKEPRKSIPTYIDLGHLHRALEKLQDQATPQPFEDAKRVLEQQLGVPLEDVFLEFEPEARAAASLAQVIILRSWKACMHLASCHHPGGIGELDTILEH